MPGLDTPNPSDLVCTRCGARIPRTRAGGWTKRYDEGWRTGPAREKILRFMPDTMVVSCPGCPSVEEQYPPHNHPPVPMRWPRRRSLFSPPPQG